MEELWRLAERTIDEIKTTDYQVAVLPIGSTEAHGPHLPYATDSLEAGLLGDRICERAWEAGGRPLLLPTIPYGVNSNTLGVPMVMSLEQDTLDRLILDIVDSLMVHDLNKLVLINGHGGNEFKPLLRSACRIDGFFISAVNWWEVGHDSYDQVFERRDDHAGEMETSVSMALFPELVRKERATGGRTNRSRFEAIEEGWVKIARPWHLFTNDTGSGNPSAATEEKGREYVSLIVDRISHYVVELGQADIDDRFPY